MASIHREGSVMLYSSIQLLLSAGLLIVIVVVILSSLAVHRVKSLIAVQFRQTMFLVAGMVWCSIAEAGRVLNFATLVEFVGPT
jgi:hypothetical protein